MKIFILIFLFFYSIACFSDEVELDIVEGDGHGGLISLCKYKGALPINLLITLNVEEVKTVILEDINAKNRLCGYASPTAPLFLVSTERAFNKKDYLIVEVKPPCVEKSGDNSHIKLTAITENGKKYYTTLMIESDKSW